MWCLPKDNSKAVITAQDQIHSAHRECHLQLPETAILFFMGKATDYLISQYNATELPEPLPRFLNSCPIWEIGKFQLCFADGGRGAPQAVDTIETLAALGVRNIISVGMCGAYDEVVHVGEIIAPQKAFVEEGTSLHYYEDIEYSKPDGNLQKAVTSLLGIRNYSIVSTDAVYRQTLCKEQLWRDKGAVGVDMETSAIFSVSKYLGLKAVAMLMISDIHPIDSNSAKWEWKMTNEMRYNLVDQAVAFAKAINNTK
jgi:purine-nucleoside phosphorylase